MVLQTDSATRSRLATYDKNICPQCSAWLLAPEWSEYLNDRCVRHTWACHACSYGFETVGLLPGAGKSRRLTNSEFYRSDFRPVSAVADKCAAAR